MLRRKLLPVLVLAVVILTVGCFDERPAPTVNTPPNNSPLARQDPSEAFHGRLLEIATQYQNYRCILDPEMKWAGTVCDFNGKPFVLPEKRVKLSTSKDDPTHGKKLYLVFSSYQITGQVKKPYPLGQAVVKESWVPEEVIDSPENWKPIKRIIHIKPFPLDEEDPGFDYPLEVVPCARVDGKVYRASKKYGLFIMYKMDPKTPGTDEGWVYGTVSADGKKVLSAGKLASCMKCHQDAPRDRLFGL